MQTFVTLLDLACGQPFRAEDDVRSRRWQLIVAAALASLACAAIWGLAAGSGDLRLALANVYKVPMVILLSTLCAVPAGLLTWKLTGSELRLTDLLIGFFTGVFAGTLVLAVLAPLVALYYHTSAWAGPMLGLGSTFTALLVATIVFIRGVVRRAPPNLARAPLLMPVLVVVAMQLATLIQFIAVASPILPETTVFDGGIDQMIGR
ncbi:MAG: hypothetical protein IT384_17400 [Deltaproteobacteria bacterium]|nr:hypothetical protein [Deltaproteobacteria bacterium]